MGRESGRRGRSTWNFNVDCVVNPNSQPVAVLRYTQTLTEDMSALDNDTAAVHLILETGQEFKEVPIPNKDLALGEFLDQVLKTLEVCSCLLSAQGGEAVSLVFCRSGAYILRM